MEFSGQVCSLGWYILLVKLNLKNIVLNPIFSLSEKRPVYTAYVSSTDSSLRIMYLWLIEVRDNIHDTYSLPSQ